jgi:LacI family transcriptional regulator, repressor for deo operon, udp, cdd, tsx, nupC, and nupG
LNRGNGKRVTLADVAKEAGVSIQTASHVLAGTQKVRLPQATRDRIREAADKVGYRPNRLAQAMRKGRSHVVAVWIPIDRPSPAYMRALREICLIARGSGYEVMIHGLDSDRAYQHDVKLPELWPVDGVIAIDSGRPMRTFRATPGNERIPLCVVGLDEFEHADMVGWNVRGGVSDAVNQMIQSGAKRIGYILPRWVYDQYPVEQRRLGYLDAIHEAGLEPLFVITEEENRVAAEHDLSIWLENHPPLDGAFGFTDGLALGAIRAMTDKGISIPDQCQVWGQGDFPESIEAKIPLSSLAVPWDRLIAQAWEWLLERIENPDMESRKTVLEMDSFKRASSR